MRLIIEPDYERMSKWAANYVATLDLTGADTFVALVPKTGPCTVADAESELTLQPGELVLVPAACKGVTLQGHCLVKSIKCLNV